MVLQHLSGFVEGVGRPFLNETPHVIRDVRCSRRSSGEIIEQLPPGRDHGGRETGTNKGDAVAVVNLANESIRNLVHTLTCYVALRSHGPKS
jgi:hypothetical protein